MVSASLKHTLIDAYSRARKINGGRVADYITELAKANAHSFGSEWWAVPTSV